MSERDLGLPLDASTGKAFLSYLLFFLFGLATGLVILQIRMRNVDWFPTEVSVICSYKRHLCRVKFFSLLLKIFSFECCLKGTVL
jgi:hypothetical protein